MWRALEPEFEMISELAQGGMGVVYKARQVHLNRVVAVKMLSENIASRPDYLQHFKSEARILASLNHPNILTIHDFRRVDRTWIIISEFIDGGSLRNLLNNMGILPVNEASRIIYALCSALYYTHARGIVHGDIKPDNVLFTASLDVKLADFGLSRLAGPPASPFSWAGTPPYMAPEQTQGLSSTPQSDIYALGTLFFEMLTGKTPFSASEPTDYFRLHQTQQPPVPSGLNQDIPTWSDHVILRCLEKSPKARYQDCRDLAEDLKCGLDALRDVAWAMPILSREEMVTPWHRTPALSSPRTEASDVMQDLIDLEGLLQRLEDLPVPEEIQEKAESLLQEAHSHLKDKGSVSEAKIVARRARGLVSPHVADLWAEMEGDVIRQKISVLQDLCSEWQVQMAPEVLALLASRLNHTDRFHLSEALQRIISASLADKGPVTDSMVDRLFPSPTPPPPHAQSSPKNPDPGAWHLKE